MTATSIVLTSRSMSARLKSPQTLTGRMSVCLLKRSMNIQTLLQDVAPCRSPSKLPLSAFAFIAVFYSAGQHLSDLTDGVIMIQGVLKRQVLQSVAQPIAQHG